jgi:general secretion pathway protein D
MIRTLLAASIATILGTLAALEPSVGYAQGSNSSIEAAAQREEARRDADLTKSQAHIAKGRDANRSRDWEQAFAHYRRACDLIPKASVAGASVRRTAEDGLESAAIRLAEQRIAEGFHQSAEDTLKLVLADSYNPKASRAKRLLAKIESPDYFNKQMTPGHRARVEEVKKLLVEAKGHADLGDWDKAITKNEMILNKDRYNVAAVRNNERLYKEKTDYALAAYEQSRAQALWEVTKEWQRPYRSFADRGARELQSSRSTAKDTSNYTRKLAEIIVPKLDFQNATIREVVDYLQQRSKALDTIEVDPARKGVNIVLKLDPGVGSSAAPVAVPPPVGIPGIPGLPDAPAPAPVPEATAPVGGGGDQRITLSLSNVPLGEALKYVVNLANLRFKVEPYAVLIVPPTENVDQMVTKEWRVRPDLIRSSPAGGGADGLNAPVAPVGGGGGPVTPNSIPAMQRAKEFLEASGVTFPPNSFAMYLASSATLVVKNTEENLALVDRIVALQDDQVIKQVDIQSKFVEITQTDSKELSFSWLLGQFNVPNISTDAVFAGGGTAGNQPAIRSSDYPFFTGGGPTGSNPVTSGLRSGNTAISLNAIDVLLFGIAGNSQLAPGIFSVAGVSTDPKFQLVIRGLEQKKGVDLLSAPRVTTKSGQRAIIEIIREFRYPIEFEPPQIPQTFGNQGGNLNFGGAGAGGGGGQGSFPVTPTTPTSFETRNTGVTLEVEPVIGPDGYTIDLQLVPQVVEFEGFINYGSPIQSTSTNLLGQSVVNVITPNVINQPVFSTRKVTTAVSVFDGSTVTLGGLVREDVQKVNDKTPILGDVPLVGRLFRSNVDQHIRRNLVIFVTATLVNPEGFPILNREPKDEEFENPKLPEVPVEALPEPAGFAKDSGFRK